MRAAPVFLLFAGHNERAVITLCRYFRRRGLRFVIVASGRDDAIHHTAYREAVVLDRVDRVLDVALLVGLAAAMDAPLVVCPTTEFINQFLLEHRQILARHGLHIGLPEAEIYHALTGKWSSPEIVQRLTGIGPPASMPLSDLRAPCVLKPRRNLLDGRVLYPRLCRTDDEVRSALEDAPAEHWFGQRYVQGQSLYLCGYLAADGRRASYWQENLLQQPDGKSMLLARRCDGPGLDDDGFFDGLCALGYHGPVMMELIREPSGRLHYIEINPRFWGPLQLALDTCPDLLDLFAQDHGAEPVLDADPSWPLAGGGWYAWAHGANGGTPHRYPALRDALDPAQGEQALGALLARHDVYAHADTMALRGSH